MKNEAVIAAVVALLKGIEVDGETMEYIIKEVYMEEQMKKQLSAVQVPDHVLIQLAADIANDIDCEGTDIIDDYDLDMNYREVSINSIDYNRRRIEDIVLNILKDHFETVE